MLEALERKLSYEDLRFYRSIARSQLRKDMATRRKLEEERKRQQPQKQTSWSSWIWGSSGESSGGSGGPGADDGGAFTGEMTEAKIDVKDVQEWKDEWRSMNESSYEAARVGRWGGWGGDPEPDKPDASDTEEEEMGSEDDHYDSDGSIDEVF